MALFSRIIRKVHRNGTGRVVIFEEHQARLPPYFQHLQVLCHNYAAHALPVQLQFSNFGASYDGQRVAIYVCPCHNCRCRQAWARHRVTGRPFRLF
jgi:hypothetical protein